MKYNGTFYDENEYYEAYNKKILHGLIFIHLFLKVNHSLTSHAN